MAVVILLAFLIGLVICYLFLWFISYLTLKDSYKYYKVSYLAIKNKTYIFKSKTDTYITFTKPKDINNKYLVSDSIYFNIESECIKLINDYIHKGRIVIFDPYSLYWYYKIKNVMMENSKSLQEIRNEKLNEILN